MQAYLADEGLARFCTLPYEKPNRENMKQMFMHLTNYSLNKNSDTFQQEMEVDDIYSPNQASKRTLTSLYKQIEERLSPECVETLKSNIAEACTGTASMLMSMIL